MDLFGHVILIKNDFSTSNSIYATLTRNKKQSVRIYIRNNENNRFDQDHT